MTSNIGRYEAPSIIAITQQIARRHILIANYDRYDFAGNNFRDTGAGTDVMKPITIPFVFGLLTSTIFVLIVLPVIYAYVRERELRKNGTLDYPLLQN